MIKIHATADVSEKSLIGDGTSIWNQSQVRENAHIGSDCTISKNVYIDVGVVIGNCVKIQNNVSVFDGVTIEDGVFVGPHVVFTNDKTPRAINFDGTKKSASDWTISKTLLRRGCSVGAGSVILPGITIGPFSMIGAGSVVTRDVPAFALVYGNPASIHGYVCKCGNKLFEGTACQKCSVKYEDISKA